MRNLPLLPKNLHANQIQSGKILRTHDESYVRAAGQKTQESEECMMWSDQREVHFSKTGNIIDQGD